MKNFFSSVRRSLVPAGAFLGLAVLLSACSKFDNDNNGSNNTPVSGLLAFNLAPDQPAIGVALGNNSLTSSPLAYTSYNGVYQPVYSGVRTVETFDWTKDSTLGRQDFNFAPDKYYSLYLVGANGNYQNVISNDNFDSLTANSGKAFVRYVNAIPDSTLQPAVTIGSGGTNVISDNAPFKQVSDFKEISSGDVAVTVKSGTAIDATRTITLEQGKIYTVLLVGQPNQTDSAKAVQIKFIANGTAAAR